MITNREHYSWSQHELWHSSKTGFYKRYFLGDESFKGKSQTKGTELAEVLDGTLDIQDVSDENIQIVINQIPKLDIQEYELNFEVGGVKMLGYVDSAGIIGDEFCEYKSGMELWDQHRVDMHGQLLFYALGFYKKFGIIPKAKLVWVETCKVDVLDDDGNVLYQKLEYTGKVETFERNFILSDLIEFEKEIVKTLKEIEDFEYIEAEIEDDLVQEYIDLKKEIESSTERMSEIKNSIKLDMELQKVIYGSSESGKFTLTSRKTKTFSKSLQEIKKYYADKIKELEKYEIKNSIVELKKGTEYLTFKEF